jgi:hypothetical protein
LSAWVCELHNQVNRKLGKAEFPCVLEKLDERWLVGRPSCWVAEEATLSWTVDGAGAGGDEEEEEEQEEKKRKRKKKKEKEAENEKGVK